MAKFYKAFCKNCGFMISYNNKDYGLHNRKCMCGCNDWLASEITEAKYKKKMSKIITIEQKNQFILKDVLNLSDEDYHIYKERWENVALKKQKEEKDSKMKKIAENAIKREQKYTPKCPTCGSTNIRRISTAEKATSAIMFGVFSNKRKYQFECQNPKCKYKW